MVCQAASQTRFRALKHENGIAGKTTIIVRVIACYQPLQDCQKKLQVIDHCPLPGDYFHLMVKSDNSSPSSAWKLPTLNYMSTPSEPRLQEWIPLSMNVNLALPRFAVAGIPSPKMEQTSNVHGLHGCFPACFQNVFPTENPRLNENQSAFSYGVGGKTPPNAIPGSSFSRFLIFDRSGNENRLIYSSVYPPVQNPATSATKVVPGYDLNNGEQPGERDEIYPTKTKLHESSDENHSCGDESEMREDTEEINALLYSDDDDDISDDDQYGDDDEVMSTGHSPITIEGRYGKHERVSDIAEEVASSSSPNKRQKLLNSGYNNSSLLGTASSVKAEGCCGCNDDANSSCDIGKTLGEEMVSILGIKRSRKDKILGTLKIIESLIPGAKGKHPVLVLDEAIDYLTSLKLKAKTLGMSYQ